jgi:hypothetical protein
MKVRDIPISEQSDVEQQLNIIEILYQLIGELRSQELQDELIYYRSDNVQSVLNLLTKHLAELQSNTLKKFREEQKC